MFTFRIFTSAALALSLAACGASVDATAESTSVAENPLITTEVNPGFTIQRASSTTPATLGSFTFKVGPIFGGPTINCIVPNAPGNMNMMPYPTRSQSVKVTNGSNEPLILSNNLQFGGFNTGSGAEWFLPKIGPGISVSPASFIGRASPGSVIELAPNESVTVTIPPPQTGRLASAAISCQTKRAFVGRPLFSYGTRIGWFVEGF
ncbi:MAG: hypothetical protein NVSMB1_23400 [Polyangiales bacterium]